MKEVKEIIIKRTDAEEIIKELKNMYRRNFVLRLRSGRTYRQANIEYNQIKDKYIFSKSGKDKEV